MINKPKAIVLYGDGINCEAETTWALNLSGFDAQPMHTTELLENAAALFTSQLLALPGGFAFGDEIASGKVLAVKLKARLNEALHSYVDQGRLIVGICNGFQVLVQMGFLPHSESGGARLVSLLKNSQGRFIDRWVKLKVSTEKESRFFRGLSDIELPVRHGEGRLALEAGNTSYAATQLIKQLGQLRYEEDVNGSFDRIAALTNPTDTVLGIMPHPEAFVRWTQHPNWLLRRRQMASLESAGEIAQIPDGLAILSNAAASLS